MPQSSSKRSQAEPWDVNSTYDVERSAITPLTSWWTTTRLFQTINHGSTDLSRDLMFNATVNGFRKQLDPYPDESESEYKKPDEETYQIPELPPYQYQPLPPDHIRLVHILSGTKDTAVEVDFTITPLESEPVFRTLSYVWGPEDKRHVECKGTLLIIRRNLYDVFQRLRDEKEAQTFWIDAICINQSDLAERAEQVMMMRRIYSVSQRTLIWLGGEVAFAEKGSALLKKLADSATDDNGELVREEDVQSWQQLNELFSRTWYHRVWIIQEVAVARKLEILVGEDVWPWEVFIRGATIAFDKYKHWQTVFDPTPALWLNNIRASYQENGPSINVLQALAWGKTARSSLDVDKVYGLLGLSKSAFSVSYEESEEETYLRFAISQVTTADGLNLLNYVDDQMFRLKESLPSWVPDWEVRAGAQRLPSNTWTTSAGTTSQISLSHSNRHLHVRGYVVDQVDRIGDKFTLEVPIAGVRRVSSPSLPFKFYRGIGLDPKAKKRVNRALTIRHIRQWHTLAMRHGTGYEAGAKRYAAYLNTIIAGQGGQDQNAHEILQKRYDLYCQLAMKGASVDIDEVSSAYNEYESEDIAGMLQFLQKHIDAAWGRIFFTTKKEGLMGLCSLMARQGDVVVVLHGTRTPFVLRRGKQGVYTFVGECYVHGLMHGEGQYLAQSEFVQDFEIV